MLDVELSPALARMLDDEIAQEPGGRAELSANRASSRSRSGWLRACQSASAMEVPVPTLPAPVPAHARRSPCPSLPRRCLPTAGGYQ